MKPTRIRIQGIDYRVEYVKHKTDVDRQHEQALLGEINYNDGVIRLAYRPLESAMEQTLLHEVIHGVAYYLGLSLDEDVVDRLSVGLYQVMRDNGGRLTK